MSADFDAMTATELRRRVAAKDISPIELTRRALAKAEATQTTLDAFFVLFTETALAAAKAAEDAVMRGEPLGLLHGVPFSAKALMAVADGRWRHSDRQDHDQRIRLQAGWRQPVNGDHPPSVES